MQVLLSLLRKTSKREFLFYVFFFVKNALTENEPHGSIRTRNGFKLQVRYKALKGKSHEHFKHEIRLERLENHKRQKGNQTLEMFLISESSLIPGSFPI
jgi:hypothetical protein